ncbi:hypothetical protein FOA52_003420 [Chlamydomonas sp. UWO 241]|nr:hypothetical protein FOA52_003420 [Chlamydomonas sp. UWO 241]
MSATPAHARTHGGDMRTHTPCVRVCACLARDVRAMPIKIINVSKGNSKGASMMADEWLDKVRRYTTVDEVTIRPNPRKAQSVEVQKTGEGEKVLKALDPRDWVVLLDERGRDVSSEDFAKMIAAAGDRGTPLAFLIGGPFGHAEEVRARGSESVRLSRCVLNHQVAHVVLLEQLYRGWTILRGEPYHH